MKKVGFLVLLTIFGLGIGSAAGSEFCDGFKRGYLVGFQRGAEISYKPAVTTPVCPVQPATLNRPKSDYEHGYIIGFERGVQEGKDY